MKQVVFLFFLLFLFCGCKSTASHGEWAWAQEKYTLNTAQECFGSTGTVKIADRVLSLLIDELDREGLLWAERDRVLRSSKGKMGVCLVKFPEKCCVNSACAPPCIESRGKRLCARKHGCAGDRFAWASVCWPPLCKWDWPEEPHCIPSAEAAQTSPHTWESALIHEIVNMGVLAWAKIATPSSPDESFYEWNRAIYGVNGVEARVGEEYFRNPPLHGLTFPENFCFDHLPL